MRICIPTNDDKGLDSQPYGHFGSAPFFVLHDLDTGGTQMIPNRNEHHQHGACQPLAALAGERVDAILVGGIGAGAYGKLRVAGIKVFQAMAGTIRENVEALRQGKLVEFTPAATCRGHGHDHGHVHSFLPHA